MAEPVKLSIPMNSRRLVLMDQQNVEVGGIEISAEALKQNFVIVGRNYGIRYQDGKITVSGKNIKPIFVS